MRRTPVLAALALVLTLGVAADATAAPTVDRVFNGSGAIVAYRFTDTSSTANDVFLDKGFGVDRLEFFSVAGGDITLTAGAQITGCTQPSAVSVSCPRMVDGRSMRMEVKAGPLDDSVSVGATVPVGVDLYGEGGSDTLTGGPGDDFIEPGPGLDIPKGGEGRDRISFDDGRPDPVAFNLGPGGALVDGGEDDEGFEDVTGTPSADTIVGDAGSNRIDGLGSGDTLDGFVGDDVLDGGPGDDALFGDGNDDVLIGGSGVTVNASGGSGNDIFSYEDETVGRTFDMSAGTLPSVTTKDSIEGIRGTSGDDTFIGAGVPNQIIQYEGGPGNDELRGAELHTEIFLGGDGADTLRGGRGTDLFTGGPGIDTVAFDEPNRTAGVRQSLASGPGLGEEVLNDPIENAIGSSQGDTLTGNGEPNVIDGGAGDDVIDGAGGPDVLIGGTQNDTVTGGPGSDTLLLGLGDDVFAVKEGEADTVDCGEGNDPGTFDAIDTLIDCEPLPDPTTPTTPATPATPAGTTPSATPPDAGGPSATPTAPLPQITARATGEFTVVGARTSVKKLTIRTLPAGGQIVMTCTPAAKDVKKKGKAAPCPFKSRANTAKKARAKIEFALLFAGRKLTPGTVVTVTVSAPNTIGKVTTFTIRKGKQPSTLVSCLPPGGKPGAC